MLPAAVRLTTDLIEALDAETALTEQYADSVVVPFELSSARRRIRIITADLKAALVQPVEVKPWAALEQEREMILWLWGLIWGRETCRHSWATKESSPVVNERGDLIAVDKHLCCNGCGDWKRVRL